MQLSMVKFPSVVVTLIVTLTISACNSASVPATSTAKPTTPATVTPTSSPTEAATIEATVQAITAVTAEAATQPTQFPQATLISFLAPVAGLEVGKNADVNKLEADGKLATGNAAAGEGKYTVLGCIGCHSLTRVAPSTEGTYTRVMDIRLKDAANRGKSADVYLAESIIQPDVYVVSEYALGIMPQDFGTRITAQDLADLVAYLKTQK
jgi:hypothetical protein